MANETGLAVRLPRALGAVDSARLPELYANAKEGLVNCYRVDECKAWADKAEAIRSYARQAKDDEMMKTAMRIKGRAVQRLGELLEALEKAQPKPGTNNQVRAPEPSSPRQVAAASAGLSKQQAHQAQAVARFHKAEPEKFEAMIERSRPATVTQLAQLGRKPASPPKVDTSYLNGCTPKEFNTAIHVRGELQDLATHYGVRGALALSPKILVKVSTPKERALMLQHARDVSRWAAALIAALRKAR